MYRRFMVIVAVLLLAAMMFGQVAAKPDPYVGAWRGIDVDGTNLRIVIHPYRGGYQLIWHDDVDTFCDGKYIGRTNGDFVSDTMVAETVFDCPRYGTSITDPATTIIYDPGSDSLTITYTLAPGVVTMYPAGKGP